MMRRKPERSAFSGQMRLSLGEEVAHHVPSQHRRLKPLSHAPYASGAEAGGRTRARRARTRGTLTLIVAAAIMLRFSYALLPLSDLVTRVTPDDAYYYFQIAHN